MHGGGCSAYGAIASLAVLIAGLWSGLARGERSEVPLTVSGTVAAAVAFWLMVDRSPSADDPDVAAHLSYGMDPAGRMLTVLHHPRLRCASVR